MSTNDVPGFDPKNSDQLAMGCWAEHDDGSLVFVESTEGNRVIYSMFDLSKEPIVEYRDAMAVDTFKRTFSHGGKGVSTVKWTWHDKTPFPWDRIIDEGASDGLRYASADDQLTAAERVAESLRLRGAEVSRDLGHRAERVVRRASGAIWDKVMGAVSSLKDGLEELRDRNDDKH